MPGKKFYVTTSIAYTNAPPHIGFALELLQADTLARSHRIRGNDVFFLTGTDEHGTKVARGAKEAGKTPEEFTEELSKKFKELTSVLYLSNDDFIRTTDKERHWPNVEMIWKKLLEKGDIYKKAYRGLYCIGCEAFLKEKDLVSGKCPTHDCEPEIIEEENYFFKLSKPEYIREIREEIERDEIRIIPEGRKNEILSFIDQGIEDISISRSKENLKWGIPVPGEDSQVIYICFEALINYIFPKDKGFWPPDVQCIGKDIFRFHSLIWPVMLLALGFERPKNILVHGFIISAGRKMSKSLGNVTDPFGLVRQSGADALRYFLLREIPPTEDGDYTQDKFIERCNADLAGGLGNLVSRVLALAVKFKISPEKFGNKIKNRQLDEEISRAEKVAGKLLEGFKFNESLASIWLPMAVCDKMINEEKPWEGNREELIGDLLLAIGRIACLFEPFLPPPSEKISNQLKSLKGEPLFPRIR